MTPEQLRAMREGRPIPPTMQQQALLGDGAGLSPEEQAMMMAEMQGGYNPMLAGAGQPDIRRVDRWLQYKAPKGEDVGKYWVTETELAEELAKANLTKEEYNWFVREYTEIEMIGGGDGNAKWVLRRQREFMMKLNMTRSRSDNPERGLRDGTLLMTQNTTQKSDVRIPTEQQTPTDGLFSFLRRR